MKSLKSFIATKLKKTPEGHVIIQEPIHFKNFDKSIQFIDTIKEDRPPILSELPGVDDHRQVISDKLNKNHHDMSPEHKHHINVYTDKNHDTYESHSRSLNQNLVKNDPLSHKEQEMHHAILKNVKPAGHEVHLYSGSRHDFSKMAKASKDHILHSPAHISATHDKKTAYQFAHQGMTRNQEALSKYDDLPMHMNHIHIHPSDKILHVNDMSTYPGEHETIVPAGTKLKYHNTSMHEVRGKELNVHHFTIHSQE